MRLVWRIALWIVIAGGAFYGADYLRARKQPLGSMTINPYYAVPQKDGKTEFMFDDPKTVSCVNSALPHLGLETCWYLSKHKSQEIEMPHWLLAPSR